MNNFKCGCFSVVVVTLAACSSTPDPKRHCETDERYQKIQETPATRVPDGLSQPKYKNTTAIPPKNALGKSTLGSCLERPPVGDFGPTASDQTK